MTWNEAMKHPSNSKFSISNKNMKKLRYFRKRFKGTSLILHLVVDLRTIVWKMVLITLFISK